jgi:hypothetical protein
MSTIEVSEATQPPEEHVAGVQSEAMVITEHGTPTAVIALWRA